MLFTNAQIVLKDKVILGSLVVEDGLIKSIDEGISKLSNAIDLQKAFLIPGLIELHTDNLDKFFTPRPNVTWPGLSAMKSHDALIIASGITTVLDAISIGDERDGGHRLNNLNAMLDAINYSQQSGLNRAEHMIHLRCELPSRHTLSLFEHLLEEQDISLVSLMDHSPGQRQYTSIEKYREYYQGKYKLSDIEMRQYEISQIALAEEYSDQNRHMIAQMCRNVDIPLASHDDATAQHAKESFDIGCKIAEFPTTYEAAFSSKSYGMNVLMGAPNVIRGGSHSGNVAAKALASEDMLHILSSDYYPQSLLEAAVLLADDDQNGYDLPKAIRTVTYNPAKALHLEDRGELAQGKKADLVIYQPHISAVDGTSSISIKHVYVSGKQVF